VMCLGRPDGLATRATVVCIDRALRGPCERFAGAGNGQREAVAGARNEFVDEAIRPLGLGSNHDLVRREGRQCVSDREQRIGVADLALCLNSDPFQPVDECGGPLFRCPLCPN
jgi:hypothetical protein